MNKHLGMTDSHPPLPIGSSGRSRFLHVFGTFDHGGAEARTVRLMHHFADRVDHCVLVGNRAAMGARAAIGPGVCVAFPEAEAALVLGRPSPVRLRALALAMRGHDLVLTYGWGGMDAVLAHRIWRSHFRLPALIHHDDGFSEAEIGLRTAYRRIALSGAERLVVPSTTLEAIALRRWGVPPARIARIGNGVDVAACADRASSLPFPGLSRDAGVVVGTVAGLRAEKNLPLLVRAVALAGPGIVLAIAGEGPQRAAIELEAERCGLTGRVILPGFLAAPHRYLASFDIFALSSDTEQFPISLAEAMAAGLPVAATDVGDVRGMVTPENARFIVPPGNDAALAEAIRTLAGDPGLRAAIGKANADRARAAFSEAEMFARYEALYASAIGKRASA